MDTLSPAAFGRALVETGDLDPIYLMLREANLDRATRARWCLAYWMFYHAGVASRIADNTSLGFFWDKVWMAQKDKWPRGTERRHFKGAQSEAAITALEQRFPDATKAILELASIAPGQWDNYLAGKPVTKVRRFADVHARAQQWRGFGPWIAFKICDMLDAVLDVPVDFTASAGHFFDDPIKGAYLVLAHQEHEENGDDRTGGDLVEALQQTAKEKRHRWMVQTNAVAADVLAVETAVAYLTKALGGYVLPAPHAPNRMLGLQEYETILCKYKSHLNGHYPVGKDTKEILHALRSAPPVHADQRLQLTDWGPLATRLHTALTSATIDRMGVTP